MEARQAVKLIKSEIEKRKLPYTKIRGCRVSFSDRTRRDCVFVTIPWWMMPPSPEWGELETIARENGFRLYESSLIE
jgi:hypothetical protein